MFNLKTVRRLTEEVKGLDRLFENEVKKNSELNARLSSAHENAERLRNALAIYESEEKLNFVIISNGSSGVVGEIKANYVERRDGSLDFYANNEFGINKRVASFSAAAYSYRQVQNG